MRLLRVFILLSLTLSSGLFAHQPKLEKMRVYLDWFPDVEFSGLVAAQKNGWYRDNGIDLEMVFNGLDIIPNVLKGQADIGMHSAHDVIRHISDKKNIKAFSAMYQLNPNCIVVRKELGISSLKDLKGRKVGVFADQEFDMIRIMLAANGLSLKDIKIVRMKTFDERDLVKMMNRGEVDAFIAWEFNWTVTFSLLGKEVSVFPGYENGFHFYGIVFFAPVDYLEKHQDLLVRFLKVTYDGWREVYKNPSYWARYVVEHTYPKERYIAKDKELTVRQQTLELILRQRYFQEGVGMDGIGRMSRTKWQKSLDVSRQYGMIPKKSALTPENIYDNRIMERVLARPQKVAE